MQYMRKNKGFTFVEMFLVAVLLAVISLAVYSTFASGIKVWQRASVTSPKESAGIFFDKFDRDLRNSFKFASIQFTGGRERLQFPTIVESPRMEKKTVGAVLYVFNEGRGVLTREARDFAHVYSDSTGLTSEAIANVKSIKFFYHFYDTTKQEYLWSDEWSRDGIPLAVRVELEIENGSEIETFYKTVAIPTSRSVK